jgi:hypothetical protein
MTDPDRDKMPASNWFWIITLILLFVVAIMWFLNPFGSMKGVVPATPTGWAPAAQSSAVPVTLPTTPMTTTTTQADSSVGAAGAASH